MDTGIARRQVAAVQRRARVSEGLLDLLAQTHSPDEFLAGIADLAVRCVDGCDRASVTVSLQGSTLRTAASRESDQQVHVPQDERGKGAPRNATDVGVSASFSVPVASTGGLDTDLTLYRSGDAGWTPEAVATAAFLADRVSSAVAISGRLENRA